MKRVLVVEDMLSRIDWFKQHLIGCKVDFAHTVVDSLRLLRENDYDTIFLDHDLNDEHYTCLFEGKELTTELLEQSGTEVARWLGANPDKSSQARVILHSLNEEGRKRMASHLKGRRVDDVPFTVLPKRLRIIQ